MYDIVKREIKILTDSIGLKLADGSLSFAEIGQIVREYIQAAVVLAEATEGASGEEKKKLVIDGFMDLWDSHLEKMDIPGLPDDFIDPIIKKQAPFIIGWAIDWIVDTLNTWDLWRKFGAT